MDCPTCEASVDAYVDGELSARESAAVEQALTACPECRERLATARAIGGLLRDLPVERTTDLLRARLERDLRASVDAPEPRARPAARPWARWSAMAASLIVAVGIGWVGGTFTSREGRDSNEAIASYLRVAMAEAPVEVASSDRHTVKPWFAGRIDYSPPVHDLTAEGFPLVGGRLDVVSGRKVSVLVYRRNQHRIVLSLWPAGAGGNVAPSVTQRDGFALAEWRHAGFDMRAVSDISPNEMSSFATAVNRAVDVER